MTNNQMMSDMKQNLWAKPEPIEIDDDDVKEITIPLTQKHCGKFQ